MKALSVALKDFQIFTKDIGSIFYLFIMPVLFIMLFAGLGAASESAGDEAMLLPVVNLDPSGRASGQMVQILMEDDRVEIVEYEEAQARQELSQAEIWYALFIPVNFSSDLSADRKVSVTLVMHPNHDPVGTGTIERVIQSAARDMMLSDYLYDSLDQLRIMQAAMPYAERYYTEKRISLQVEKQKKTAEERPLVAVEQTTPVDTEDEQVEIPNLGQTVSVGFAVLFVFLASQNAAQSIFREKRQGSFRRLLAAPISKLELMSGKLLPNLIMTLVQIAIIFLLVGLVLLPIMSIPALNLSSDPLGLVLTSILAGLCSTSLGLLLAAIARTEGQLGGISGGLLWVAGILGGAVVPLFLFPEFMLQVAKFIPHYWAVQAYYGLILRGETLAQLWPNLLALLGFTVVFFIVGLWRFEFD
jgi:ABC-2 type transport system permease protein